MEGDRIANALARISTAADRIDACRHKAGGDGRALTALERRHAALRDEAGAALRGIDSLIAELER